MHVDMKNDNCIHLLGLFHSISAVLRDTNQFQTGCCRWRLSQHSLSTVPKNPTFYFFYWIAVKVCPVQNGISIFSLSIFSLTVSPTNSHWYLNTHCFT